MLSIIPLRYEPYTVQYYFLEGNANEHGMTQAGALASCLCLGVASSANPQSQHTMYVHIKWLVCTYTKFCALATVILQDHVWLEYLITILSSLLLCLLSIR